MRKRKFTFKDWISIIISVIADLLFLVAFVSCYVFMFFNNPCFFTLIAAVLTSTFPGLFCYGITTALWEFIHEK